MIAVTCSELVMVTRCLIHWRRQLRWMYFMEPLHRHGLISGLSKSATSSPRQILHGANSHFAADGSALGGCAISCVSASISSSLW